jgi:nucleolar pre-ribosomal-associated protein 1
MVQVLTNITRNMKATTSLVLRSSLLSWIDIQLLDLREEEADAWIEILDNVVRCLNHDMAERATLGSWRRSIIACLGLISALQGMLFYYMAAWLRCY